MTAHDGGQILDEARLRKISRSIRTYVPSDSTADAHLQQQIKDFKSLIDDAFRTSSTTTLGVTHRVAAWNTLCSLIDQSVGSTQAEVRSALWNDGIWSRAFELYLQQAQSARPKASRQLLTTLTNALRKSVDVDLAEVKQTATKSLVLALFDYDDLRTAKVAAPLLAQFILKGVVSTGDVLIHLSSNASGKVDPDIKVGAETFLEVLFRWLGKGDFGSTIAHLVSVFLDKLAMNSTDDGQPIWSRPLQIAFTQDAVSLNDLRAHILPVLFKRSFEDFVSFLEVQGLSSKSMLRGTDASQATREDDLLFASLQTGKELGMLYETDDAAISQVDGALLVPLRYISNLFLCSSRSARLTALYLLITSHSVTRPFSHKGLQLIRNGLDVLFADVDADFRSDVFSAFQRLVDRFRAITAVFARQSHSTNVCKLTLDTTTAYTPGRILAYHREFLQWLLRFLAWQLRPTASYQRHISALKCMALLAKSGLDDAVEPVYYSKSALGETKWPFHVRVVSDTVERLLVDLTFDPFDDVRQTASGILTMLYSSLVRIEGRDQGFLTTTLARGEATMLATGRADHADGVAHLYALEGRRRSTTAVAKGSQQQLVSQQLLDKLEQMLAVARCNLAEAVARYPLHGLLISLRYVLSQRSSDSDSNHEDRLVEDLHQVWDIVKPVLCDDAPEGYTTDELEETPDSTKETLSYCWRALKEASLLMSTLVTGTRTSQTNLEGMSNLCLTQLAELRHRGAFSTVAQTWISCCIRCKDFKSADGEFLLHTWYGKALDMLRNNVTINTRRSAGLPSLLCGILIADKTGSLLSTAFQDLEAISRQEVDAAAAEEGSLPQVHAMNCIKDVLKNTRLGEQTEPYVPVALQLAADALRSDVWAIRNCGLMLFRAVIDRLLGTDQSHFDDDFTAQKTISVHQHPHLIDVILKLIPPPWEKDASESSSTRFEGVFPALQLLQHTHVPEDRGLAVDQAVNVLTGSTSWHVRDKAARVFAGLMAIGQTPGEVPFHVLDFIYNSIAFHNELHGALLAAQHSLRRAKHVLAQPRREPIAPNGKSFETHGRELMDEMWFMSNNASLTFVIRAATVDVMRAYGEFCFALGRRLPAASPAVLLQGAEDPIAAALRQAIARLMAQQLSCAEDGEEETPNYSELILDLARQDEDACKHFLQALDLRSTGKIEARRQLVTSICTDILNGPFGVELKCEAQSVLLTLAFSGPAYLPSHSTGYLLEFDCNQRYADQWLEIRALQLDNAIQKAEHGDHDLSQRISSWVDECVSAVAEEGIHTREAAAFSLDRVRHLWQTMKSDTRLSGQFRRLCIAVYDLLNDDDEDLRLIAARITQRILASSTNHQVLEYEPIVASQKLLGFCIAKWASSQDLARMAFKRAFEVGDTQPASVADQLAAFSQGDTALFVEEKQNLYIDDAREVRVWSQVVQRLSVQAVPRSSVKNLASWVTSGLDVLACHARDNPDGALGWSSKPDVFKLGMQVLYGAEVLLDLVGRGVRLQIRPSELRRKLFECASALERSEVNCLWRWEVQRILAESVAQKLVIVKKVMDHIHS